VDITENFTVHILCHTVN